MSRVYFDLPLSFGDLIEIAFAPSRIRSALKAAKKMNFQPDISQSVRQQAIKQLRSNSNDYVIAKGSFQSGEALAVLAYMDTFQSILRKYRRKIRKVEESDPQSAAIWQRKVDFYNAKLAACGLYMRRSGHMTPKMLGSQLYRATMAIETMYRESQAPSLKIITPLVSSQSGHKI
ncbi:MAG: hypothetical protein Hens3KO_02120 [Henriciella sp.]